MSPCFQDYQKRLQTNLDLACCVSICMFACFSSHDFPLCVFNRHPTAQKCKSGKFEALSCPEECMRLSMFTLQTGDLYSVFPCHLLRACWVQLTSTLNRNMQIQRICKDVHQKVMTRLLNPIWGVEKKSKQAFRCLRGFI